MIEKVATFFKKIIDYSKSEYCLLKYFKDAFIIINKNIVLSTPLLFFSMFMVAYMLLSQTTNAIGASVMLFLMFAIISVFLSGWYYTIKLAIENFDFQQEDKEDKDALKILKQFPTGVAEHFIQVLLMLVIFTFIYILVGALTSKIAYHIIGNINISNQEFMYLMSSPEIMKNTLPIDQQIKLANWILIFCGTTLTYIFLVIFWTPEIIFNNTNVFKAFLFGLKNLFKRFFKILAIFCTLLLMYFIISIFMTLNNNKILGFILLVIYYYFLFYASTIILLFYKREIIDNEQ